MKPLETLKINNLASVKIAVSLADDNIQVVSQKYGMILPASNTSKSVRGVF
jgi:hypothetical protein